MSTGKRPNGRHPDQHRRKEEIQMKNFFTRVKDWFSNLFNK